MGKKLFLFLQRLQHLRVVRTSKVQCGYALGVAPVGEPALKTCRGTVIERTKQHIISLGGRVDSGVDHIKVVLLKDTEDLPPELDHVEQV